MDWTNVLNFPIKLQVLRFGTREWETVFEAKTRLELNYRIDAHLFSVHGALQWRFVDSHGQETMVSNDYIQKYQTRNEHQVTTGLSPLRQFTKSAPHNAVQTAIELVAGASAAKHYTILPESLVHLGVPGLAEACLVEFADCVSCEFRTKADSRDHAVNVSIFCHPTIRFTLSIPVDEGISALLILIASAIVRDFWVCEQRDKAPRAYGRKTHKTIQREGKGKHRKLVKTKQIIYLPRFVFDPKVYEATDAKSISHAVRVQISPHLVSGHLRKLPDGHQSSEAARQHAKEFGMTLGEGQTFVRPYEVGAIEQLRTYRSKSALQLLFSPTN